MLQGFGFQRYQYVSDITNVPLQKLHATTFGPEPDCGLPVLPGKVAERLLCAACCSEAGLIGGSDGADIGAGVAGDGSGNESVAMCGNSLVKNEGRDSAGGMGSLEREEEGMGPMSRRSCICPNGGGFRIPLPQRRGLG